MKYYVDFQYMPKGSARPIDDGVVVGMEHGEVDSLAVIPAVGDFVQIIPMSKDGPSAFNGRVKSRLFRYMVHDEMKSCGVNIVVEETDDDWSKLIKE